MTSYGAEIENVNYASSDIVNFSPSDFWSQHILMKFGIMYSTGLKIIGTKQVCINKEGPNIAYIQI